MVTTLGVVAVLLLGGCDAVFGLDRDPVADAADAPIDSSGEDSAPRCAQPAPDFGLPIGLVGAFSPPQTVIGPISLEVTEGDVMVYAVDDGSMGTHYNVLAAFARRPTGGEWTHQGYVAFSPQLASAAVWPRLWREDGGQIRMFFETNGQRRLATPTDAFNGMWGHVEVTQSAGGLDLPTDHIAGLALGGARVIVARESDRTIIELERDVVTGAIGPIVPSTDAINTTGGGSHPSITADGCWLLFDRPEADNNELWIAVRGNDGNFEAPRKLLGSSTALDETWPSLSEDGTTLYYSSWDRAVVPVNYEKMTYRLRE
ncbi:MAG: hypothetical protein ACKV2T_07985 [Kofleriaceae bacterium]